MASILLIYLLSDVVTLKVKRRLSKGSENRGSDKARGFIIKDNNDG